MVTAYLYITYIYTLLWKYFIYLFIIVTNFFIHYKNLFIIHQMSSDIIILYHLPSYRWPCLCRKDPLNPLPVIDMDKCLKREERALKQVWLRRGVIHLMISHMMISLNDPFRCFGSLGLNIYKHTIFCPFNKSFTIVPLRSILRFIIQPILHLSGWARGISGWRGRDQRGTGTCKVWKFHKTLPRAEAILRCTMCEVLSSLIFATRPYSRPWSRRCRVGGRTRWS